jgi:hypothetical protein
MLWRRRRTGVWPRRKLKTADTERSQQNGEKDLRRADELSVRVVAQGEKLSENTEAGAMAKKAVATDLNFSGFVIWKKGMS